MDVVGLVLGCSTPDVRQQQECGPAQSDGAGLEADMPCEEKGGDNPCQYNQAPHQKGPVFDFLLLIHGHDPGPVFRCSGQGAGPHEVADYRLRQNDHDDRRCHVGEKLVEPKPHLGPNHDIGGDRR